MPLGFESVSHGTVPFGFFNIETDMILLNHYFLFAGDFCRSVSEMAESPSLAGYQNSWVVFTITGEGRIGNLMGAIHGEDHSGLIGEVYRRYPFPKHEQDFRQKPEGFGKRSEMEALILDFGGKTAVPVRVDSGEDHVSIGEFTFNRHAFGGMIRYIWRGGLPRWRGDVRPDYVLTMREKIETSGHPLFRGLKFDP